MSQHIFFHTVSLTISILLAFVLGNSLHHVYDIEILAVIFIIYIFAKRFLQKKHYHTGISSHQLLDAVFAAFVIINIVVTTGSLSSPIFFLVYFLLFGIALMLEPAASVTGAVVIVALFVADLPANFELLDILPLVSLPFIVPFATYIGNVHRQIVRLKKRKEAVTEDALMFSSLVVKGHLKELYKLAEDFRGDHELTAMKRIIRRMTRLIDSFEDDVSQK